MQNFDVAIIGAGASGLACAINTKKLHPDFSVTLFEKFPRVGKKILVTGNGRCNLTNIDAVNHNYRNKEFCCVAFERYPPEKVIEFFNGLGLVIFTDDCGRVYPRSNTASAVLDALRYEVEKLNINVITEEKIESISKKENFTINNKYSSSYLVLATGGKSSPSQGSDGSGFALAKGLGHKHTALVPSLVPLNSRPEKIKSLKGIRVSNVRLTLECEDKDITTEGEILFTENGISGICAMELASFAERKLRQGLVPILHINFLPEKSNKELQDYIKNVIELKQGQPLDNLLTGLLHKQIGIAVLKDCKIYSSDGMIKKFSDDFIDLISNRIIDYILPILGTRGFANAQVTSGGISVNEVDRSTMKSKLVDKLYFCGEILDVDGGCGGYNLQWAFASGLLAGELND